MSLLTQILHPGVPCPEAVPECGVGCIDNVVLFQRINGDMEQLLVLGLGPVKVLVLFAHQRVHGGDERHVPMPLGIFGSALRPFVEKIFPP